MNANALDIQDGLWKFSNNKVWAIASGMLEGTVRVELSLLGSGMEAFLDAVSEAVTGSTVGLEGITWRIVGPNTVRFGAAVNIEALSESELPFAVSDEDKNLASLLKSQYGLSEEEARHAVEYERAGSGQTSQEETVVELCNGKQLRCPANPASCSYIRVVIDGFETAFWSDDEFELDTAVVMGSLMGAAASTTLS